MKYTPPDGFVLTRHEGYHMNAKGFVAADGDDTRWPDHTPEKPFLVAHFDEDEPFDAANNPNVTMRPIEDGWVPPRYTLTHEDDPTPVVEPAQPLSADRLEELGGKAAA